MGGTRVLVVGGGLGIGQYVTEYLVDRYHARVVILSLDVAPSIFELQTRGGVQVIQGDATSSDARDKALKAVEEDLGGLDALVVTMGIIGEIETVANLDVARMRKAFDINVFAPIEITKLCLPLLRQSEGRIIHLSSAADRGITWSGWSPYSTSKAALTRFIEVLGHEEELVKVCGVYPGLTRTAMVTDLIAGKFAGKMKESEVQEFKRRDQENEVEPPEWSANVVAKLAAAAIDMVGQGEVKWYYDIDPDYKDFDRNIVE